MRIFLALCVALCSMLFAAQLVDAISSHGQTNTVQYSPSGRMIRGDGIFAEPATNRGSYLRDGGTKHVDSELRIEGSVATWHTPDKKANMGARSVKISTDTPPVISYRTNLIPVSVHGVDLKRFVELSREFAAEPPAWREAVTWSEYQRSIAPKYNLTLLGTTTFQDMQRLGFMPMPPLPPDNNETPEGLRARANTLEAMIEANRIAQAYAKKVSEERQARWKEYQAMLVQLEEAMK